MTNPVFKVREDELPSFLRERFDESGLTQAQLAGRLDLSVRQLQRAFEGKAPLRTTVAALEALGYSVEVFAEVKQK